MGRQCTANTRAHAIVFPAFRDDDLTTMATKTVLIGFGGSAVLCAIERAVYPTPAAATLTFPPMYGLVVLVNVVASSFALLVLGMKVGGARKKHGVSYPAMYASGTSAGDVKFNCIQRGHQQALETYPSFLACSIVGGLAQPLVTAAAGAVWIKARLEWASAYAEHGADGRYNSPWSRFIWYALLCVFTTAVATGLALLS